MSGSEDKYAWDLSQGDVDRIASALNKLVTLLDVAAPGTRAADTVHELMADLRLQCCERGGAADPFPDMPLTVAALREVEHV